MKSGKNFKRTKPEKRVKHSGAPSAAELVTPDAPLFPEIIGIWNDGHICLTETAGARLLGARRPALLNGRSFLHFVPPENRAGVRKWMKQLAQPRRAIRYELSLRRFDGSVRAIETLAIPSTRDGQAVVEVYGWDITSRKRAEMKLADLAGVVESSNDAIFSRNPDGTITSWNKAAEHIFGYSHDEIVGHSCSIIEPPQRSGEFAQICQSGSSRGARGTL
jgi:PAS domain S-box-containing protein